jgi:hypothetical protein
MFGNFTKRFSLALNEKYHLVLVTPCIFNEESVYIKSIHCQ